MYTFQSYQYGQGTGPVALDYVSCDGDEPRLVNCSVGKNQYPPDQCGHGEDVGVRCHAQEGQLLS